tara:strand:- start:36 stop:155 length:120 start_codon:yes stop_codon:yes gene_type:complete
MAFGRYLKAECINFIEAIIRYSDLNVARYAAVVRLGAAC